MKGPVTEEPVVDLGIENDVKSEIRRKEKRRRIKARTRNYTTSNVGKLNQILSSDDFDLMAIFKLNFRSQRFFLGGKK